MADYRKGRGGVAWKKEKHEWAVNYAHLVRRTEGRTVAVRPEYLTVGCPTCCALRNCRCRNLQGEALDGRVHEARGKVVKWRAEPLK